MYKLTIWISRTDAFDSGSCRSPQSVGTIVMPVVLAASLPLMIWLSDDQGVLISIVVYCETHLRRFHFLATINNVHEFYF